MNLNPGDPCKVRLHDGRVVEAIYDQKCYGRKWHIVDLPDGSWRFAVSKITYEDECRFVGQSCVLEPV